MDLNLENKEARQEYLNELDEIVTGDNIREHETDVMYNILEATFVRDTAEAEGYDQFSQDVQEYVDKILWSPEEWEKTTDEEALRLATVHPGVFGDVPGLETERKEDTRYGRNIANQFVEAEQYEEARRQLEEFEQWYRKDIAQQIADNGVEKIELRGPTFDAYQFGEAMTFNSLGVLLTHREKGELFIDPTEAVW